MVILAIPFLEIKMRNSRISKLREDILAGANSYKKHLTGKYFLCVFENKCIEIAFKNEHFKHLTGVESLLGGKDFYKRATKRTLTCEQFRVDKKHPYSLARKKCDYLGNINNLFSSDSLMITEFITNTFTYEFGITNLELTLGLIENDTSQMYNPRTLRIKDKAIEKSRNVYSVDFVFCKNNEWAVYEKLLFGQRDNVHALSPEILQKIRIV